MGFVHTPMHRKSPETGVLRMFDAKQGALYSHLLMCFTVRQSSPGGREQSPTHRATVPESGTQVPKLREQSVSAT